MTDWERHNNMLHLRGMSPASGDGRAAHWAADRIESLEAEMEAHLAFHRLTVMQRDQAWQKIEALEADKAGLLDQWVMAEEEITRQGKILAWMESHATYWYNAAKRSVT